MTTWTPIPQRRGRTSRTLLWLVVAIFLCGLVLATARNDQIVYPFFSIRALWHLVSAFGFVALWAFNHVRFAPQPRASTAA